MIRHADAFGDARLDDHPDRHGFTMQHAVVRRRLDGMCDGMPEVQHLPQPAFALVSSHDAQLDHHAAVDDRSENARLRCNVGALEHRAYAAEVVRVRNRAVLDDLGESGA